MQLPAQRVEVARRRARAHDLDVVLGVELQEALEPGRAVLRTLPLVAVRQEVDQAAQAQPLALARADELVVVDLGAVGEVAELGLPDRQAVGVGQAVAVLEAEHALLGQDAVDHLDAGLLGLEVLQRDVLLLGDLVVDDRVALAERAAADILARQADREALDQQRGEGQMLGGRPVDAGALLDRLAPLLDHPAQPGMDVERRPGGRSSSGRARAASRSRPRCRRAGTPWALRAGRSRRPRASRPCWPCSCCDASCAASSCWMKAS